MFDDLYKKIKTSISKQNLSYESKDILIIMKAGEVFSIVNKQSKNFNALNNNLF